jgi:hypothetical protein
MFGNTQIKIFQQINNLNSAIQSYNIKLLKATLDEANRKFNLFGIVLAEYYLANEGVQLDNTVIPQYENYVALANKYIDILQDELNYLQSPRYSQRAINQLFNNQGYFTPTQVIHQKNGQLLTVSNILSVIGYATKAIETLGVKIDGKYSVALMILNTIDLALNNRKPDKPLNKALHLANDVLSEVAKKVADDERAGQVISGTSLLFDLTIDFLVKE